MLWAWKIENVYKTWDPYHHRITHWSIRCAVGCLLHCLENFSTVFLARKNREVGKNLWDLISKIFKGAPTTHLYEILQIRSKHNIVVALVLFDGVIKLTVMVILGEVGILSLQDIDYGFGVNIILSQVKLLYAWFIAYNRVESIIVFHFHSTNPEKDHLGVCRVFRKIKSNFTLHFLFYVFLYFRKFIGKFFKKYKITIAKERWSNFHAGRISEIK